MASLTTTRIVLRQRLSEATGDWFSGTTTSAGNVGGTTLLDTSIPDIPEGGDDDGILNWFVLNTTSGSNDGDIRRVSAYTASTGTITFSRAFPARVGSGATYELHRTDPEYKHQAINRAAAETFPTLYLPLRDETIVIDDLLSNSDFETFSGGFTSWTTVNGGTVGQGSGESPLRAYHGSDSAKITSHASNDTQITQAPSVNMSEMAGKTVTFKMWAWASAANVARLRLDWDGSDIDDGDYHAGDSSWRLLTVSAAVPTSATQMKAICEVESGANVAYFDAGWMAAGPVFKYTIPAAIILGPHYVTEQYADSDIDGPYYGFGDGQAPLTGRRLRLEGMGTLSQLSTDAGTMEIGEPRVTLILAYAARWLARRNALQSTQRQRESPQEEMRFWEEEINRLINTPGHRMASMGAQNPSTSFHIEEDSSGRYLIFDKVR
jgi:hypothetical protein